MVCHTCDNPSCVRQDHLFLGTHRQNIADRDAKKRQAKGEQKGNAVLTEALVRQIRIDYATGAFSQQQLADVVGVSQHAISRVIRRANWKHVA